MRIYSMTATFGKLEQQTLTLQPGLNVIHAPNEWGKSTWCAFLVAMLYGIDTRERTTQTSLADKERYAPWSGSPMSGRMDLSWNGRDITIERRTKGRSVFGDFKAYETGTGLPVPELTAANCGQMLLGVEKNVFTRAGFIRQTDLPVTEDDALRRRLNALLPTGDESGASDALAQKLKDLKNRCRHNRTGALPQAEAQRDSLQNKLNQLHRLQAQIEGITQRQSAVEEQLRLLDNHRAALAYEAAQADTQRVAEAADACKQAESQYLQLQALCNTLPARETAEEQILQLEQLRLQQDTLDSEILPECPVKPEPPAPFASLSPEQALQQTTDDYGALQMLIKPVSPIPGILGILCILAALVVLFFVPWVAPALLVLAVLCFIIGIRNKQQQSKEREAVRIRYGDLSPEEWVPAARAYVASVSQYDGQYADYTARKEAHAARLADLEENIAYFTQGAALEDCLEGWRETLTTYDRLTAAHKEYLRSKSHAEALAAVAKPAAPPAFTDTLTYSGEETLRMQGALQGEHRQLQLQQGQCLGQMEALGQEEALVRELSAIQKRIDSLEDIYAAITIAQQTLTEAANELQRKFAPKISQQAQDLFAQLTNDRYNRLTLREDLRLEAGAADEITLMPSIWRSEGTVDQLYLSLRIAVARELTPTAPLVLDDALVRFDDTRMQAAMEILNREAASRQILLFSCQSREADWLAGH